MRFFEYEARKIVEVAGIPVTKYGFCTTADEARKVAEEIGGPVVIKSQVLSGGRMKAGGVKFADTPEEAAEHAEAILKLLAHEPAEGLKQAVVFGASYRNRPLDHAGVILVLYRSARVDQDAPGHVAADLELQDLLGVLGGLLRRVGKLDAAGLHPAAAQDL